MEKFDVIIVGAGPGGLKCAEVLSKSDKKVLLLEKTFMLIAVKIKPNNILI
jgi:flavin-dependent dehydrogenase